MLAETAGLQFCQAPTTSRLISALGTALLLLGLGCGSGSSSADLPTVSLWVFTTRQPWPGSTFKSQSADTLCQGAATQQLTNKPGPVLNPNAQWVAWISSYDAQVTKPENDFSAKNRLTRALLAAHPAYTNAVDHFLWYGTDDPQMSQDPLIRGLSNVPLGPRASSKGITTDENGIVIDTTQGACEPIWTGTDTYGAINQELMGGLIIDQTCRDINLASWNSNNASGSVGCVAQTGKSWTDWGNLPCSKNGHIVCFQVR